MNIKVFGRKNILLTLSFSVTTRYGKLLSRAKPYLPQKRGRVTVS